MRLGQTKILGSVYPLGIMEVPTTVEFSDVNGRPQARTMLLGPLRIGDPVALKLVLQRQNGGRTEVLSVDHKFRVTAIGVDGTVVPSRQLLSLDSVDKVPTWKAVKKTSLGPKSLGPTRFPRTPV